ncbi:Gfo/Idh/MocA family protein [Amnibacterium flavum]|uniref:Gfo/Idh/MocA family oxidoreductase n=1 Tax=Amnibacterium flavum TaxID=2173173 RepID=A0A2V1HTW6_9MICO|nr:Gfo/Idh/MocA family oxidoreductase [Amnibacterium flavum]PVZ95761.1 gfo/Idh/MocA family oxidoreductase [Amnibacterium flavum]
MTTRIGILGAAGIAPAAIIRPVRRRSGDAVIAAVASRRAAAAAEYAATHGIESSYGSYAELLADPTIDLVYNALPPSEHAEWTIAALEAGKDVLCEKPSAMNATQSAAMVEAAERTGRRLIEAFHDRYHPLSARIGEYLTDGSIGTIQHIEARFTAEIPFDPASIRHEPTVGGGALMDLGCYPVHWIRAFMGEEPRVVSARAEKNALGADQSIEAQLEFPSGATATIVTSMDGPLEATLSLTGSTGTATIDSLVFPSSGHSVTQTVDGVDRQFTVAGLTTYDHQLDAVLRALETGEKLPTEGADIVANMALIDAIYEAAGFDRSVA